MGDGELNEGQCWEAFQFIAHNRLNRCIVIIDDNKKQLDGYTADVMNPFDIAGKMRAFGFATQRVNGQDVVALTPPSPAPSTPMTALWPSSWTPSRAPASPTSSS